MILTIDAYVGDGSTQVFGLTSTVAAPGDLLVTVAGALQMTGSYAVSGTDLIFAQAPALGASVQIRFLAPQQNIDDSPQR